MKIKKLADDVNIPHVWFVGNLVNDDEDKNFLQEGLGQEPIAYFPDSQNIRKAERDEKPIITLEDALESAPAALISKLL